MRVCRRDPGATRLQGGLERCGRQPGLVADSLNPAKARILLMTALTQTKNPQLIQQYFHTY